MKKTVVKILLVLSLLSLFIVGVDWVLETTNFLGMLSNESINWRGMRSLETPWQVNAVGAALLLLPIITACAWVLIARDDAIEVKSTDGDQIALYPRAIERAVGKAIREKVNEAVAVSVDARQALFFGRNAPVVRVVVVLTDELPLPEGRKKVRSVALGVMKHLLGVSDVSKVKVRVRDVDLSKRRTAKSAKAAKKAQKDSPKKPAPKAELPAETKNA